MAFNLDGFILHLHTKRIYSRNDPNLLQKQWMWERKYHEPCVRIFSHVMKQSKNGNSTSVLPFNFAIFMNLPNELTGFFQASVFAKHKLFQQFINGHF